MLTPLYGFLEGDTLGLIVLVQDSDPVQAIVDGLCRAACMRVAPADGLRAYVGERPLHPRMTVADAGLGPLDRVDVRRVPGSGTP